MSKAHAKTSVPALTLGAIGVVYGDIGTSVLYSVKEVFNSGHVAFNVANIYGVLSLFVDDYHHRQSQVYLVGATRRQ